MSDTPPPDPSPAVPQIPEAVVRPRRKWPMLVVWLVPVIAILFGAWVGLQALRERGTTITISFKTGEGIEARKTKIKFKNVDIGEVRTVTLSEDRSRVIVTAQITREAENLLVEDTRFWVVRPRISAGSVTGLGTLLAGSHIGMDAGRSTTTSRDFVGLEQPAIFTTDLQGRQFMLRGEDLGSLDIGSPIYFRHIQVGQVVGYDLDQDGKGVTVKAFINAPYDKHVNPNSRFWYADGFDVTLDANGLKINTQSVVSILLGGLAFESLPDADPAPPSAANASFEIFADRARAMKATVIGSETFVLVFKESVRGLTIGAPVDFRGVVIGEVLAIDVTFDPVKREITVPVKVRIYTGRLRGQRGKAVASDATPCRFESVPGSAGEPRLSRATENRKPAHRAALRCARFLSRRAQGQHRLDKNAARVADHGGEPAGIAGDACVDRAQARQGAVRHHQPGTAAGPAEREQADQAARCRDRARSARRADRCAPDPAERQQADRAVGRRNGAGSACRPGRGAPHDGDDRPRDCARCAAAAGPAGGVARSLARSPGRSASWPTIWNAIRSHCYAARKRMTSERRLHCHILHGPSKRIGRPSGCCLGC